MGYKEKVRFVPFFFAGSSINIHKIRCLFSGIFALFLRPLRWWMSRKSFQGERASLNWKIRFNTMKLRNNCTTSFTWRSTAKEVNFNLFARSCMLWEARWVMVNGRKLTAAWISRSALLAGEMLLSSQEFDLNRPAINEVSWSSCLHRILWHFRATSETSAISTTISRILLNLSVWDNHHQFKA